MHRRVRLDTNPTGRFISLNTSKPHHTQRKTSADPKVCVEGVLAVVLGPDHCLVYEALSIQRSCIQGVLAVVLCTKS